MLRLVTGNAISSSVTITARATGAIAQRGGEVLVSALGRRSCCAWLIVFALLRTASIKKAALLFEAEKCIEQICPAFFLDKLDRPIPVALQITGVKIVVLKVFESAW